MLLLAPGLAFAGAYKCVVDGKTTYSQYPCGKNAQEVPNQIVVVPAQRPVDISPSRPAGGAPAGAAPAQQNGAPESPATADAGGDCKARMQRYLDAQDCFNRFRKTGGTFTGDSSACPNVPYPGDCTAPPF